jgi:hypothetical protein
MADVQLDISSDRTSAGKTAGDTYTVDLETIRNDLDKDDASGTTLGSMVKAQLSITEAETRYQVRSGIPNKVSKSVGAAAQAVKQAAG